MKGLAWRWIGLHAAAFAAVGLFNGAVQTLPMETIAAAGGWRGVVEALVFGLLLAVAETRIAGFPVSWPIWGVASAAGLYLGLIAAEAASQGWFRALCGGGRVWPHPFGVLVGYGGLAVGEVSLALILASAQGAALWRRRPQRSVGLWILAVTLAVLAMDGVGLLVGTQINAHWDVFYLLPRPLLTLLDGLPRGVVFGAATFPVLRRVLASESVPTA